MLPVGILQLVREFPDPVLLVSTAGEILASNAKATRLLGCGPNPPAALHELLAGERADLVKYLRLCSRTNEAMPGAFTLRAAPNLRCRFEGSGLALVPGEPRCVWLKIRTQDQAVGPFLALNQRIEHLLSALHARSRAEASLRDHTAQFEALLNQSPLGIYLVDSHLRILQMNPTAAAGLRAVGGAGQSLEDLFRASFSPSLAEETIRHFRHTLETGEPHIVAETIDQRINGDEMRKYYTWQIHRIPLPGNTWGLVCYFQDISARRQAEESLRKTEKLAAVGRLAASIAHEINNPLEAVTNLLYLARADSTLREDTRRYLIQADIELERITHLARQTLGFYRDSTAPVFFEPSSVIDSVLALYEHRFRARKVRLVAHLQKSPPIYAFAGEFRQVLSNLIVNALDAMEFLNSVGGSEGVLTVRARASRAWRSGVEGVRITIADNGSGISPDRIDHIFDAFFTTKKDTGTGLGLWLSQEIIQKHEGRIYVKSRLGPECRGTIFTAFWPARPTTLAQPKPEQQTAAVAV